MKSNLIAPPYLEKGDKIAIVAPARKITPKEIRLAITTFEKWGLEIELGKNLFASYHQYAGTDKQRAEDFQKALDNNKIKAIFCARGGYGTVRIIDLLNFNKFKKNPKWIVGYSDVTVLHSHIHHNLNIQTLHAIMPFNFSKKPTKDSVDTLHKALFGEKISYTISASSLNRQGTAEGILVGGNLSVLYSLLGSSSAIDTAGKILFIEDLDEYVYHIDRMMVALKRAGKLDKLRGIIVGGMTEMKDNLIPFGKNANQIVAEAVRGFSYPICFGFSSGHGKRNLSLILGKRINLSIGKTVTLNFLDR